jgi:hypothetical protein
VSAGIINLEASTYFVLRRLSYPSLMTDSPVAYQRPISAAGCPVRTETHILAGGGGAFFVALSDLIPCPPPRCRLPPGFIAQGSTNLPFPRKQVDPENRRLRGKHTYIVLLDPWEATGSASLTGGEQTLSRRKSQQSWSLWGWLRRPPSGILKFNHM